MATLLKSSSSMQMLRRLPLVSTRRTLASSEAGEWKDTARPWKLFFFTVCIPAMGLGAYNAFTAEEPPPPEFKPYRHMRIHNKDFPWRDGVKTLFHNPHTNPLPEIGYEHSDENH